MKASKVLALAVALMSPAAFGAPAVPLGTSGGNSHYGVEPVNEAPPPGLKSVTAVSWEAAVIAGTADFVAKRAEDELVQWFLSDMVGQLCDATLKMKLPASPQGTWTVDGGTEVVVGGGGDRNVSADQLMPRLCALRAGFGSRYVSASMIAAAVEEDLELVPTSFASVIGYDWPVVFLNALTEMRLGEEPSTILSGLDQVPVILQGCAAARIQVDAKGVTMSPECAVGLMGTIVRAARKSPTSSPSDFATALQGALAAEVRLEGAAVTKIVIGGQTITASGGKLKVSDVLFAPSSTYKVDAAAVHDVFIRLKALRNEVELLSVAHDAGNLAVMASSAAAIGRLSVEILETAASTIGADMPPALKVVAPLLDSAAAMVAGKYVDGLVSLSEAIAAAPKVKEIALIAPALRYLPLLIDLSAAKDADTVASVLEAAASPVGAWKMKRSQSHSFGVGSLPGVIAGGEVPMAGTTAAADPSWFGGLFVPIGLDYTYVRKPGKSVLAPGVFLSLVDVGALSTSRFGSVPVGNEDVTTGVESEPEVGFAQVFSPGLFLKTGLGETPFVLGLGAQWTPDLRTANVAAAADTAVSLDSIRVGVVLSIDVTIFQID